MPGGAIPTTPINGDSVAYHIFGATGADSNSGNYRQNGRFDLCRRIDIQQCLPGYERAVDAPIPQVQFVYLKLCWSDE